MTRKRRCKQEGCVTLLSSFNPDDRCFVHAPYAMPGLGNYERRRRQEELDGLHPEALDHVDQPMSDFERYRRRLIQRPPRDVMEA